MKISALFSAFILALTFATASTALAAKNCKKGKPCGNACISKDDVCHKPTVGETADVKGDALKAPAETASAPAAAVAVPVAKPEAAPETAVAPAKVKTCKKGKPCGNSCISEKATCHANQ